MSSDLLFVIMSIRRYSQRVVGEHTIVSTQIGLFKTFFSTDYALTKLNYTRYNYIYLCTTITLWKYTSMRIMLINCVFFILHNYFGSLILFVFLVLAYNLSIRTFFVFDKTLANQNSGFSKTQPELWIVKLRVISHIQRQTSETLIHHHPNTHPTTR